MTNEFPNPLLSRKNSLRGAKNSLLGAKKFPAYAPQFAMKSLKFSRLPELRKEFPCQQGICPVRTSPVWPLAVRPGML
ncbi:MAG: hypothetical protein WA459_17475 [Stellaceae bacterium]